MKVLPCNCSSLSVVFGTDATQTPVTAIRPPRSNSQLMIQEVGKLGVGLKMLTGDQQAIAFKLIADGTLTLLKTNTRPKKKVGAIRYNIEVKALPDKDC